MKQTGGRCHWFMLSDGGQRLMGCLTFINCACDFWSLWECGFCNRRTVNKIWISFDSQLCKAMSAFDVNTAHSCDYFGGKQWLDISLLMINRFMTSHSDKKLNFEVPFQKTCRKCGLKSGSELRNTGTSSCFKLKMLD